MAENDNPFEPGSSGPHRIRPRSRTGLNVEEIKNKTGGNYIFSFGFPGSGKTTFQWMMMNYLLNEGPFHSEIQIPDRDKGPDWEGRNIINTWKNQWIEGRFPDPTASGESDIREVQVHAKTTAGKKLASDFSFLEVSGELMRQVLPESGTAPDFSPLLSAYLANPRLKFCVILMLTPEVEENDQLFASFMAYIQKNFPGLKERMSLGVVVSKPEESLVRLQTYGTPDGRMAYDKLNAEALVGYLNRFCGETYQIWATWPKASQTLLAPLRLGEIEISEGEPHLVAPDFSDIEEIFFWVFEQFTGKRPGPTFIQRSLGKVDWR